MRSLFRSPQYLIGAALVAVFVTLLVRATGQEAAEGEFTTASMNGRYAFVAGLGAGANDPGPNTALFLVAGYNGDGTADILTLGSNRPGEDTGEGAAARDIAAMQPDPPLGITYEVSPYGTLTVIGSDGEVDWDGLIVRSEMIDGVSVATEYVLFNREPDPDTGGLRVGRGVRQSAR